MYGIHNSDGGVTHVGGSLDKLSRQGMVVVVMVGKCAADNGGGGVERKMCW